MSALVKDDRLRRLLSNMLVLTTRFSAIDQIRTIIVLLKDGRLPAISLTGIYHSMLANRQQCQDKARDEKVVRHKI